MTQLLVEVGGFGISIPSPIRELPDGRQVGKWPTIGSLREEQASRRNLLLATDKTIDGRAHRGRENGVSNPILLRCITIVVAHGLWKSPPSWF